MFCENCGQQFQGSFCPNCGAPRPANQSSTQNSIPTNVQPPPSTKPKPITSKWWFWVLLIATVAVVASMLFQRSGTKDETLERAPEPTLRVAAEQLPEPAKKPGSLAGGIAAGESVEKPSAQTADMTLEETVLLDNDGIRVTATGFSIDEWMGPQVGVLIENDSNRTVVIQPRYTAVNGAMIMPMLSCEVTAGKRANEAITFYQPDLEMAGIETIQTIELVLMVLDNTSYETLYETEPIILETSAPKEPQSFDDNGTIVLEQDGFKMVVMGMSEEDSYIGKEIVVYMENSIGREITVQLRNVSLNGYMIDPIFSTDIADGKIAYSTIAFMTEDLEANGIDEIQSLECNILVYDSITWDDIFLSDPVTINFPF